MYILTRRKVFKVAIKTKDKAKDIESWKCIDKESQLMRKVDWREKLIDEKSWLTRKVYQREKLIDEKSWLTRKANWWVFADRHMDIHTSC